MDDGEFAARAVFSRRVAGLLDTCIEAGYTRFGLYYDATGGDGGPPYTMSGGEALNSFDLSFSARWHATIRALHPYISLGAGAYAVHGYFPESVPLELSRQVRPGVHGALGVHGVLLPALGLEARWLTIFDGGRETLLDGIDRNRDVLHILFSLTAE